MDADEEIKTGKVDWYTRERGFGVIKGDDGVDYFVHSTNLNTPETIMLPGRTVAFKIRSRKNRPGFEAYDVEYRKPVYDESQYGKTLAACLEVAENSLLIQGDHQHYILWSDLKVRQEYSEMESSFQRIQSQLKLEPCDIKIEYLKRLFLEDVAIGAVPKFSEYGIDWGHRRGVYAPFERNGIILVVHGFYKSVKTYSNFICWRARATPYLGGTVIKMPDKENNYGKDKPHQWCERFDHFIYVDLPSMVNTALSLKERRKNSSQ